MAKTAELMEPQDKCDDWFYCSLIQARVTLEKEISTENIPPKD